MIPQTDPKAAYLEQQAEIDAAIQRQLASGWYILGKEVAGFEGEFAAYLGLAHGVGVANGTDALVLALKGLGMGPGSMVATVAHTAVATVVAVEQAGATPVLIDIDPLTYTMDPVALQAAFEAYPAIEAVIPVHLYGQPADLPAIQAIAHRQGAKLIEDCAQAHGAKLDGRMLGTWGDVACFSLYPTKNLGALGDGGIIATGDAALAAELKALRQYGWREHYVSDIVGMNSRLDELQAAILRVKLTALDRGNARRRAVAASYDAGLAGLGLGLPLVRAGAQHVYHQYAIRTPDRDGLKFRLRERGVATNIHYPVPVHRQAAYLDRLTIGPAGLAETEHAAAEVLSLPMYPQLGDEAVAQVIAAVRAG
ncbi:MAG TPA: DegT/DnrJ/EryC1/StrS family aminotransferase [Aliidongia sp.]|uniref:DegT/DnrJ/EryC1/StrS family aminotransferase n=1 Tax=Aliidongia sp. TaxID=1914230 RepID=UPI002DDCBAE1|nr:DegT/DnrJ/EryC1/StrS family aminotransferase [Aliidongia sp.]HEV2674006.1 DegT/DnrJ/EryC1/StrS family aminotransferase [Aliidongia sp.]